MTEETKSALFAVALLFYIGLCVVGSGSQIDWSQPILSEKNPNGTVDYWYLFDNAN
jgi:hypothetical protein